VSRIITHSEALNLHRSSYGVQPFEAVDEVIVRHLANSEDWLLLSGINGANYACVVGKVSHIRPRENEESDVLFSFRCRDVNGRPYIGYVNVFNFTAIIPVE